MNYAESILPEFDREMASTRKVLERVPGDKLDWQAHPQSHTIGWNANHLAEILGWVAGWLTAPSWDFAPTGGEPYQSPELTSRQEILDLFDRNAAAARKAIAAVGEAARFGPRPRAQAGRLGPAEASDLTGRGDGADWTWQLAQTQFAGASGVLDVSHACEHLAAAGKQVFGEGTGGAAAWLERGRGRLLADGWPGLPGGRLAGLLAGADTAERHAARDEPVSCFAKHTAGLNYAGRLAAGRSIGSGLAEGAVKQAAVRRPKQTGAQGRAERAGPSAQLCALAQGPDWNDCWVAA